MRFFSKTLDKLKTALKKTADVLNTDVRTLFIPGRQIDDAFLDEILTSFIRADMGLANAERITAQIRDRWRLGKIKNAEQAEQIVREEMTKGWDAIGSREITFQPAGTTTVIMVCGVNGAGRPPRSPSSRTC
jgi:fused signal recognition particle receptor